MRASDRLPSSAMSVNSAASAGTEPTVPSRIVSSEPINAVSGDRRSWTTIWVRSSFSRVSRFNSACWRRIVRRATVVIATAKDAPTTAEIWCSTAIGRPIRKRWATSSHVA